MPENIQELSQLLEKQNPALLRYIRGRVRDSHFAEDILQDTLLDAHRNLSKLKDAKKLSPWLRTICKRKISAFNKSKKFETWAWAYEKGVKDQVKSGEDAAPAIEDVFEAMFLRIHHCGLTSSVATMVLLRHCLDLKPAQIGALLEVAPGTVSNQLNRANRKIRDSKAPSIPADPAELRVIKKDLAVTLSRFGLNPMKGKKVRDMSRLREAARLLRKFHGQYPQDPTILSRLIATTCILRMAKQYHDEFEPHVSEENWKRELWDDSLLPHIHDYYSRFRKLKASPDLVLETRFTYMLYTPSKAEDVLWSELLAISGDWVKSSFRLNSVSNHAMCLNMTRGPSSAAQYLETFVKSSLFKNSPIALSRLCYYNRRAGNWEKAKTYYRRMLRKEIRPHVKKRILDLIQLCDNALKK